jgi:hypothetical protein
MGWLEVSCNDEIGLYLDKRFSSGEPYLNEDRF